MKIQIVSDLHLEFNSNIRFFELTKPDTTLVIAGDTVPVIPKYLDRFKEFLQNVSDAYTNAIIIAGNHEYYHGEIESVNRTITDMVSRFDNIYFLLNSTVEIDDVVFIGSTLWTDFDNQTKPWAFEYLNDSRVILNGESLLTANDVLGFFNQSSDFLLEELDKNLDKKTVVITHNAPSYKSIAPEFIGNKINCMFANNMEYSHILRYNPNLWIHGHTHRSFDYEIGDTRVVCNPVGYLGENPYFNPTMIVEI